MSFHSKWKKKTLFVCIAALSYAALSSYYKGVDGFFPFRVKTRNEIDPKWSITSSVEEDSEVTRILSQPFTYLTKGRHTYAFVSEDGLYVLKLLKQNQIWPLDFLRFFPGPSFWKAKREKMIAKREIKKNTRYQSLKLANDQLKEVGGLIYVHINTTNHLHKTINLYNRLHMSHQLNADSIVFIVQKKVEPLGDYLKRTLEKIDDLQQKEEIKNVLASLYTLLQERAKKGIADRDQGPKIFDNYGVLDGKIVWIDIGGAQLQANHEANPNISLLRPLLEELKIKNSELYDYWNQLQQ